MRITIINDNITQLISQSFPSPDKRSEPCTFMSPRVVAAPGGTLFDTCTMELCLIRLAKAKIWSTCF